MPFEWRSYASLSKISMGCCYTKRPCSPSNTRLEDFSLVRSIGKGAFGKVCIVYNKAMKKHYALKYMSKRRLVCKNHNVLRELEILKELSHTFIVNLYFTFQDESYIFMVSDLLLGGDLEYHLKNGKFSEPRLKLYICEIALAIDYLQQHQIMHRDIKPANLLLDEKGHVHLTDFNLATKLEPNSLATSFSGTKPYMAPEILGTHLGVINGYGLWVDFWSLGITFFECLRGRQPYDFSGNTTPNQMLAMIMNEAYLIPANWCSDLVSFIKCLLHIDIDKRITSFDAFKAHRYMQRMDFDAILSRQISPIFVPKQRLNCDLAFELEERIVESSPLHKHYRRKQHKKHACNSSSAVASAETATQSSHNVLLDDAIQDLSNSFVEYNRFLAARQNTLVSEQPTNCSQTSSSNLPDKNCPASKSNKQLLKKTRSVR
ncbi:Kinase domain protein [Aphelenchoides bicaudatus]|nr:Kinase domain protein [Aphelenchoides bicaudatus]